MPLPSPLPLFSQHASQHVASESPHLRLIPCRPFPCPVQLPTPGATLGRSPPGPPSSQPPSIPWSCPCRPTRPVKPRTTGPSSRYPSPKGIPLSQRTLPVSPLPAPPSSRLRQPTPWHRNQQLLQSFPRCCLALTTAVSSACPTAMRRAAPPLRGCSAQNQYHKNHCRPVPWLVGPMGLVGTRARDAAVRRVQLAHAPHSHL